MWTPATALLWECWRLSRWTLAILMFGAALLGATLLAAGLDERMAPTMALAFAVQAGVLASGWALNVDRRKGFTLVLGFARPIPTWVLVSVPMAYIGVSCAMTYLVPMLALRATFGIPFPLLPVAALASALGLVLVAVAWWSGDPTRRRVAWAVLWLVGWLWFLNKQPLGDDLARWPELFSFSATLYFSMALVSVAAIGATIVGVGRQRRGDDRIAGAPPVARPADTQTGPRFTDLLAERLAVRCPVSSPTRAQLWFEMNTGGCAVLKFGVLTALVAPAALTVAVPPDALYFWGPAAFVVPPIFAFRSILGVQRKQGSSYLSAFAATRAMGTARIVGLKVLVASLSVLVAWAIIGTSLWMFAGWLVVWGPDDLEDLVPSPRADAWLAVVVAVVTALASGLALRALLVLNPRRAVLSGLRLGVYIALSVSTGVMGWVAPVTIWMTNVWIVLGTAVLGTAYLFRWLVAERIFSPRGLIVVLGIWAGIALMSPAALNPDPNDDFNDRVAWFTISLLPLSAAALAPWSLSRLRHR